MAPKNKFTGSRLAKGFATDPDAERDGVWRRHADFGIHVRVRRSTNHDHLSAVRKHYKPFAHLTRVAPKDELLVKQKAASETLVADWGQDQLDDDGAPVLGANGEAVMVEMTDADGQSIRPSQDNVLEAFIAMPDFFRWVASEADTFEHFRVESVTEASGNSLGSSPGSASGEPQSEARSSNEGQIVESSADRSPPSPS